MFDSCAWYLLTVPPLSLSAKQNKGVFGDSAAQLLVAEHLLSLSKSDTNWRQCLDMTEIFFTEMFKGLSKHDKPTPRTSHISGEISKNLKVLSVKVAQDKQICIAILPRKNAWKHLLSLAKTHSLPLSLTY